MLSRVLTTTLAGALPPAMVRVERRRSFVQWMTRQRGVVIGVAITAGDKTLRFRSPAVGVTEASVSHTVRGIALATTPISVADWIAQLGELLNAGPAATKQLAPPCNVLCYPSNSTQALRRVTPPNWAKVVTTSSTVIHVKAATPLPRKKTEHGP